MTHYVLDTSHAGAGDTVTAAWLAAGANGLTPDVRIRLHAGRHRELARALGCPTTTRARPDGPKGHRPPFMFGGLADGGSGPAEDHCVHLGLPGRVYPYQISIGGGERPITETWQDIMPWTARRGPVPAVRPTPRLPESAFDWAYHLVGRHELLIDRPIAVLFPRAAHQTRAWPGIHWHRLAWGLHELGYGVIALDSRRQSLDGFPVRAWGQPWPAIMALMLRAAVVVCNESGPAHVAGTLQVPTCVILGPTRFRANLGYLGPKVHGISVDPERVPCVGCHFAKHRGYSAACVRGGCEALHALSSREVLEEVRRWLVKEYCRDLVAPARS